MVFSQVSCYVNIISNALDKYFQYLLIIFINKNNIIVNYWFNTAILFVGIDNEFILLLIYILCGVVVKNQSNAGGRQRNTENLSPILLKYNKKFIIIY